MEKAEYEFELIEAEKRLERLRALYEQYFRGIERREPTVPRRDLERRCQALRRNRPRNTALRFRFQTLMQRYTTLRTHWNRIGREIENGTYRRDRDRINLRRKIQKEQREEPAERSVHQKRGVSLDMDVDIDQEVAAALRDAEQSAASAPESVRTFARPPRDAVASRPKPPPPPPPRPSGRKPPPPPPPPRIGEERLRGFYDEYVSARQRNIERTDNIGFEKLKRQIRKMEPKLNTKYGGKPVDFKIVVKDGRVGLKPVKKGS